MLFVVVVVRAVMILFDELNLWHLRISIPGESGKLVPWPLQDNFADANAKHRSRPNVIYWATISDAFRIPE